MSAHTAEPWRVSKYDQHRVTSGSSEVAQDDPVCQCDVIPRGKITDADIDRQRQADAARIVACVNACAALGLNTAELENGLLDGAKQRYRAILEQRDQAWKERDVAETRAGRFLIQRDELAKALRLVQRGFKMGAVKAAALLADDPDAETLELISLEAVVDAALAKVSA